MSALNDSGTLFVVDDGDESLEVLDNIRRRLAGDDQGPPFGANGKPCPVQTTDGWWNRHAELLVPKKRGGLA